MGGRIFHISCSLFRGLRYFPWKPWCRLQLSHWGWAGTYFQMFRTTLRFDQGSAKPQLWGLQRVSIQPAYSKPAMEFRFHNHSQYVSHDSVQFVPLTHWTFHTEHSDLGVLVYVCCLDLCRLAQETRRVGSNGGYPNKQETCKTWRDHRYLFKSKEVFLDTQLL